MAANRKRRGAEALTHEELTMLDLAIMDAIQKGKEPHDVISWAQDAMDAAKDAFDKVVDFSKAADKAEMRDMYVGLDAEASKRLNIKESIQGTTTLQQLINIRRRAINSQKRPKRT